MMAVDNGIPLCDGDITGEVLMPESPGLNTLNGRRRSLRRACENVCVCFSPEYKSGRVEYVECPVLDISASGISILFDGPLEPGMSGRISYRADGSKAVRIASNVRTCTEVEPGVFTLGLKFVRGLTSQELRLAKRRIGREVAPGVRLRKLKFVAGDTAARAE